MGVDAATSLLASASLKAMVRGSASLARRSRFWPSCAISFSEATATAIISLVMKAIFRMGVPVAGKNYFPSNIQGLPTWYEIRVTRDAYAARAAQVDIIDR